MSDPRRVPRASRRPRAPFVIAAVVFLAVVATLGAIAVRAGDDSPCPDGAGVATAPVERVRVVAVQLTGNTASQADRIARMLRPLIEHSVRDGSAIRLTVDRGASTPLVVDDCLDGLHVFAVEPGNPTREQQDLATTVNALTGKVAMLLRHSTVVCCGTALRVLRQAAADAAAIASDGHTVTGVAVVSDFLGEGPDCLGLVARAADQQYVRDVVDRCVADGVLPAIEVPVQLIGAGSTERSAKYAHWARDLASAICREIASGRCEVR